MNKACPKIIGKNLTVAYGDYVLLQHADFTVNQGDVFIIMGASGGGKSSLLRVLTGLMPPAEGEVIVDGENFSGGDAAVRDKVMRRCGILYQSGALFSSMTLGENVALPLQQYTDYSPRLIKELVDLKLALVGLGGFNDFYPSEISGGIGHVSIEQVTSKLIPYFVALVLALLAVTYIPALSLGLPSLMGLI